MKKGDSAMETKKTITMAVVVDEKTLERLSELIKHELTITEEKTNHSRVIRQLIREQWKRINDGTDMKSMHTGQQATCGGLMSHLGAVSRELLDVWEFQDDDGRRRIIDSALRTVRHRELELMREAELSQAARAPVLARAPAAAKANGSA